MPALVGPRAEEIIGYEVDDVEVFSRPTKIDTLENGLGRWKSSGE